MLNKMQEGSLYRTSSKRNGKEKNVSEHVGVEFGSSSDRFRYQNYENSRIFNEGSSKDCYDELREVIRESLGRHNLLLNGSVNGNVYPDRKGTEFSADLPSTSSSRSSTTYSHDFASSESTCSSKVSDDKPKASNLIAKLMGLEDICVPSKGLQFDSGKHMERDKKLNPKALIFDIDMPNRRKHSFSPKNVDRECMTLDQIIQNMQFKGLLNRDHFQIDRAFTSDSENRNNSNTPPVVLMKHIHSGTDANDILSYKFIPRKSHVGFDKRPNIGKTQEVIPSRDSEHSEQVMLCKPRRSSYVKEPPVEKIAGAYIAKPSKKALQKPVDKEVKIKEQLLSNKEKMTDSASFGLQKDIYDKKAGKAQKATRKSVEKENLKSTSVLNNHEQPRSVSGSHEQQNIPAMSSRKSETRLSSDKKHQTTQQRNIKSKLISNCAKSVLSHSESDQAKTLKYLAAVNDALETNVESIVCKDHDSHVVQRDVQYAAAAQLIAKEELENYEIPIKDIYVDSLTPHRKDTLLTILHKSDTDCPQEATYNIEHHHTESTSNETRTTSSNILTRSFSIFNRVEDLFDNIDTYQPTVLKVLSGLNDCDGTNSTLLFDCANELLDIRSQRHIPPIHPLIQRPLENTSFCISNEQLLQEVRDGIQSLISFTNCVGRRMPANAVLALLEKDLWCKGPNVGAWDEGWRDGYTELEVQSIACDLDKLILGELIEEIFANFCS